MFQRVVLTLGVAAIVVLLVMRGSKFDSIDPPEPAGSEPVSPTTIDPIQSAPSAVPVEPEQRRQPVSEAVTGFQVSAVDGDGRPISGAEFRVHEVWSSVFLFSHTDAEPVISQAADDSGTAEIPGVEPDQDLALMVAAPGYRTARRVVAPLASGELRLLRPIVLEAGAGLMGNVTDDRGRPLDRARVVDYLAPSDSMSAAEGWSDEETVTDSRGQYTLSRLRPGRVFVLFDAEGYLPLVRTAIVSERQARILDGVLVPGQTLRGQVVDPGGVPIAGVRVGVDTEMLDDWPEGVSREALTDERGHFEIPGLPDEPLPVHAEWGDYSQELDEVEVATALRLKFPDTSSLLVRAPGLEALGSTGYISLTGTGGDLGETLESDELHLQRVPVGRWEVRFSHPLTAIIETEVTVSRDAPAVLDLELEPGPDLDSIEIVVECVDTAGAPIPGLVVHAKTRLVTGGRRTISTEARTDENGRCATAVFWPASSISLTASGSGWATIRGLNPDPGSERPLRLVIPRAARLQVVTLGPGGRETFAPQLELSRVQPETETETPKKIDSITPRSLDGRSYDGIAPGSYTVRASHRGVEAHRTITLEEEDLREVVLEFPSTYEVEVHVTAGGDPIPRGYLALSLQEERIDLQYYRGKNFEGAVVRYDLPTTGTYSAWYFDGNTDVEREIVVNGPGSVSVDLDVRMVTGRLVDAEGERMRTGSIYWQWGVDEGGWAEVEDGEFLMSFPVPGSVRYEVEDLPDGLVCEGTLEISDSWGVREVELIVRSED